MVVVTYLTHVPHSSNLHYRIKTRSADLSIRMSWLLAGLLNWSSGLENPRTRGWCA
jgi:hypothetical protein